MASFDQIGARNSRHFISIFEIVRNSRNADLCRKSAKNSLISGFYGQVYIARVAANLSKMIILTCRFTSFEGKNRLNLAKFDLC